LRALVYSALRWLPRIDRAIDAVTSRPLAQIQPEVLDVLRVGAGELLFGTNAGYAVVSETVETIKDAGVPRAAGFVNAAMRRIAENGEPPFADGDEALQLGVAPWILDRLTAAWDADEASAFLGSASEPPGIGVRVRPHATFAEGDPVPGIGGARAVSGRAAEAVGAAVRSGDIVITDAASVAVASAVRAAPGMVVLDAAAAPGGKTSALWDAMNGEGTLVAADRSLRRIGDMRRRLRQIGIEPQFVVADATRAPFRPETFDRVLLDAPCTGLGTWRRRPEIPHRLQQSDAARMGALQRSLVESALALVKPGGMLIYSVCTVFPEETVDVAADLGAVPPEGLPGRVWGDGRFLAPHLTGTDAMFVAEIRR
jgi:16S rRNA (cytosine967-C5)-methyltransferase